MKKWLLALAIFICCLLFFISGTLVGYSAGEKTAQESSLVPEKEIRKPSKNINPLIGRIINRQVSRLNSKTRIPTPKAVTQARQYKSRVVG